MSYPSIRRSQKRTHESYFSPWESNGMSPPRNYHKPNGAGDWEKPTQFYQRCDKPDHLLQQKTSSVNMGTAVDVVYLDVSKVFNSVSHLLLLDKLAR